jgi:hypothetical protein
MVLARHLIRRHSRGTLRVLLNQRRRRAPPLPLFSMLVMFGPCSVRGARKTECRRGRPDVGVRPDVRPLALLNLIYIDGRTRGDVFLGRGDVLALLETYYNFELSTVIIKLYEAWDS